MKHELIIHEICSVTGSNESTKVELVADTTTGETNLVISKTITERYPITDYGKVMKLHAKLNHGMARRVWSLEDLT